MFRLGSGLTALPTGAALWVLAFAGPAAAADAPVRGAAQQEAAIIAHLNSVLDWYHQVQATDTWVIQPTDEIYITTQRDIANQVVANAFAYAHAMVAVIGEEGVSPQKKNADTRLSRLTTLQATNAERLVNLRDQESDLAVKLAGAPTQDRTVLLAQREVIRAQIDLDTAIEKSIERAASLFSNSDETENAGSFAAQIAALQQASPSAIFDPNGKAAANKPAPRAATNGGADGLFNRAATLFSLVRYQRGIDTLAAAAAKLQSSTTDLAQPLSAELRSTLLVGTQASQNSAQLTDAAQIDQVRDKLEALTRRFKDLSAALMPLREEQQVLEQTRTNLVEWKRTIGGQRDIIVRIFLVRAVGLLVAIAVLAAISELWRRATLRYVKDARRRRQFLLIRRFATAILLVVILVMGFVSNFSSFATFAGFITAGIAVALQTIILSIAAYFFLVGRFGVRVGDRVTVSGVTGDVIDIGLVRVFLMELAGIGVDLHPTGRVVILANSALFSTTPVYKQLPGTNYAWHELFVVMAADADPEPARDALFQAVNGVYAEYRPSIERQHGTLERLLDYKTDMPVPSCHVRASDPGLEVVIRYPAEIRRMSEIDERVTIKALAAITANADLKKSLAAMPRIRSAVKS
jgi:small-conductance mechanosensitive channel